MEKNYLLLIIVIIVIFIIHKNMSKMNNMTNDNIEENTNQGITEDPIINEMKEKIKETYKTIRSNVNKAFGIVEVEDKPLNRMIQEREEGKIVNPKTIKKDTISPDPTNTTEYRFVDETPKTSWSDVNVSQHPKYHTSKFNNQILNTGSFFNEDKFFHDKTSPYSTNSLPDRCKLGENNEVLCDYNNKLQLVPPTLIKDKENNPVINSIGESRGSFLKTTNSSSVDTIHNKSYEAWNYEEENTINGGKFYDDIVPSSPDNNNYLVIDSLKKGGDYSF